MNEHPFLLNETLTWTFTHYARYQDTQTHAHTKQTSHAKAFSVVMYAFQVNQH